MFVFQAAVITAIPLSSWRYSCNDHLNIISGNDLLGSQIMHVKL